MSKGAAVHFLNNYWDDLQARRELLHKEMHKCEATMEALRKERAELIREQSDIYNALQVLKKEQENADSESL